MAAIAATLACIALPQRADAQELVAADSDGYVPVYDVCFAGSTAGYYSWYNDGYTTFGEIYMDTCLLESYGAGPADYDRVLAHEQGHAAGLVHSSDPSSVMYPSTIIYGGEAQYEAPEPEQYEAPETEQYEPEQYEAPETEQYEAPEDEQYALDLDAEVQQYEPGEETETSEAPSIREAPREERPPVRIDDEAEKKETDNRKKAEERKKAEKRDEAAELVRVEAAALARAVDGADTLTAEEPRERAEALTRALEESEAEDGPLADARTEAKAMAEGLTEVGEHADAPSGDRAGAVAETREKAEALAGALDRAGSDAGREARAKDLEEASEEVRTVASELSRAEAELEDQETEGQDAEGRPPEAQSTQEKDTERGFFARIREFFASTFG